MFNQTKYRKFMPCRQVKRTSIILSICTLFAYSHLFTMEHNGRGAKAIGMANTFTAISDNVWAIDYNPAGLTQITIIQCSAFMVPDQFGLSELRTTAIAAAVPFSFASLGLKIEKFGFDLYKETEFGIAGAVQYDQSISIGLSFNLNRIDIERYGAVQSVLVHGGVLAHILSNVKVGFNFNNITGETIVRKDEKIPQVCALGTCWSPTDDMQLSMEIEKDVRYPASIKIGIEKILFNVLALRTGLANNPNKYSAGIGTSYSFVEFGYAGYSHVDLGWTHQIELSFQFDK